MRTKAPAKPGTALSPQAAKAGGALARILGDSNEIARYASGEVKRKDLRAIGMIVVDHKELNSDHGVGGLIWLSSFHGEPIGKWLDGLVAEYPFADILLTIEYLYDKGVRSDTASMMFFENEMSRDYVPMILELLELHKQLEDEPRIRTVEQLDGLVEVLGGIDRFGDYDTPARIEEALEDYRNREE